ncbi:MAG TPA: alpha/beta fold hydrolase [Steroidobacteraceae bacterium]|nr:alpha/beta fold hydrolase [Steroidobacteraceae bacterium]
MLKLIILPGLDGTGARIRPFMLRLEPAARAHIIAYPTDRALGYAELEPLIRAALPAEGRYALLAESFSGPLAIRIAADPPAGLAGVILCGTFAKNPFPWLRPVRALAAWLPVKSLPRWLRAPLMWDSRDPRDAPPRSMRSITRVAAAVVRRRLREVLRADETRRLAALKLPVLILTAARDRIVPRSATRILVQGTPHAQVVEIDAPHLMLQTRPNECATAVLRFLERWN